MEQQNGKTKVDGKVIFFSSYRHNHWGIHYSCNRVGS